MAGFANDAKKMLELLGGKENIVSFTHCATRMRFVLKDQKQADVKAIEELSCVKGSFTQGGQFQIIIGNKVSTFYDDFVEASRTFMRMTWRETDTVFIQTGQRSTSIFRS